MGASLQSRRPLELAEKTDVVFVELANVRDIVPPHADSFHPQTKGEATHLVGIVTYRGQHVRIDHAGSAHLDPAVVPSHIDFDAGFGEWEERRPEADMHFAAEIAFGE